MEQNYHDVEPKQYITKKNKRDQQNIIIQQKTENTRKERNRKLING